MSDQPRFGINLEFPLILIIALIVWQHGGYTTALFVAWTMVVILLIASTLLTYVTSTQPHNSSVQIGGVKIESRISPLPSRRSLLTLMAGALAFLYLSWNGHPLVWVGVVALVIELLPGAPSIWDEYLADVLRRATVQAGFAGMLAAIAGAILGGSGLEVAVLGLSLYLLTLQFYLYRWQRSEVPSGDAIDS